MKCMSDKKFNELITSIIDEHDDKVKEKYEIEILKISSEKQHIQDKYYNCKSQLRNIESNKVRYLQMLENKNFKSKRLKKKYRDKLIRKINLLYGEI